MPAPADLIASSWDHMPKPCVSEHGLVQAKGCQFLIADEQDAKLPVLSEDPSCSHDSEGGMWHLVIQPQSVPDGDTGVPCMADELELQAEEIEEQDPWAAEDDGVLGGSVSSLDSCAVSGPPHPAPLLQPAWATTAESAPCLGGSVGTGIVRKPAASSFPSSDDSWVQESSIPVCRTLVLGVRMRAVQQQQQQAGAIQQAVAPVQSWLAAAATGTWLQPAQPHSWRGCRKGPRCDREDRHRGVCNMRAAPAPMPAGSDTSADDATDEETLVPDALLSPDGSPYGVEAGALLQEPACCVASLACPPPPAPLLAKASASAALPPPPAVPLRQSQRRLKMTVPEAVDAGSQESAGDAFVRHSLGSRRGSSEMVSDGNSFDSSDEDEGGESHSIAVRQQPLVQQAPARTCQQPAGKRAASEHGRDLLDLVPPPKLPRCASASSVLQRPAAAAAKAARRTGSGRTASVTAIAAAAAAGRPRKRAGGGRGTGPLAATLPGQHCQYCHTQVTPVWRAGPGGPKTLCNACGVRYMKTSGRAKGARA